MSIPRDGGLGGERSISNQHSERANENAHLHQAEADATQALQAAAHVRPDIAQKAIQAIETAEQKAGVQPDQIGANLEMVAAMFNRISDKLFKQDGPNGTSLLDRMRAADPAHYNMVMDMLNGSDAGKMVLAQQSFQLNDDQSPQASAALMRKLRQAGTS